ncbi:MAG: hypothetical protein ACOH1E_08280 [Brevundimonas sp.]
MTVAALLRTVTAWGWVMIVAGALIVVLIALQGLGFRWDPFGLTAHRMRTAEARASAAETDAAARRSEAGGAVDQIRRLDEVHQQTVAVARATARTTTQARSAQDAEIPIDPDRADRLLRHDGELCRLAPIVCSSAAAGPAQRRDDTLRAGTPAGSSDPG